jgi:hypothetical protein
MFLATIPNTLADRIFPEREGEPNLGFILGVYVYHEDDWVADYIAVPALSRPK